MPKVTVSPKTSEKEIKILRTALDQMLMDALQTLQSTHNAVKVGHYKFKQYPSVTMNFDVPMPEDDKRQRVSIEIGEYSQKVTITQVFEMKGGELDGRTVSHTMFEKNIDTPFNKDAIPVLTETVIDAIYGCWTEGWIAKKKAEPKRRIAKLDIQDITLKPYRPIVLAIYPTDTLGDTLKYFRNDDTIHVVYLKDPSANDLMMSMNFPKQTQPYRVILIPVDCKLMKNVDVKGPDFDTYVLRRVDDQDIDTPEDIELVDTLNVSLRDDILMMFGWVKFPVFTEQRSKSLGDKFNDAYYTRVNDQLVRDHYVLGIDSHGHGILRTVNRIIDVGDEKLKPRYAERMRISEREADYGAYLGLDFVTISKKDARAILDILDEVLVERNSEGDAEAAFGSKGISYERLHDRLSGTIYWGAKPK